MEEIVKRMAPDCVTEPLLELNLELNRSFTGPVRTISPESADVKWHLKVNNVSGNWYLRLERSGQKGGDPLYCICDISGPDFAYYFEYYFTVETFKIMLIPKIRFDEEDPDKPVNITCKVLKRRDRCYFRADSLNTCSETLWWEFPLTLKEKKIWSTGFGLMIKSHSGRMYQFEVVLHRSGEVYLQTQRAVPGHVRFWGSFQRKEPVPDFTFSVTLKKGDSKIYVCDVNRFTIFEVDKTHQAFCCTLFVRADFPRVTN